MLKALWGQCKYFISLWLGISLTIFLDDENNDPSLLNSRNNDLLDNNGALALRLMTGLCIHAPEHRLSEDMITKFNVKILIGVTKACKIIPKTTSADSSWNPDKPSEKPWSAIAYSWTASETKAAETVGTWVSLLWKDK